MVSYAGAWPNGDKYTCPACRHTAIHLSNEKRKEGRGCGLRPTIGGGRYGLLAAVRAGERILVATLVATRFV